MHSCGKCQELLINLSAVYSILTHIPFVCLTAQLIFLYQLQSNNTKTIDAKVLIRWHVRTKPFTRYTVTFQASNDNVSDIVVRSLVCLISFQIVSIPSPPLLDN